MFYVNADEDERRRDLVIAASNFTGSKSECNRKLSLNSVSLSATVVLHQSKSRHEVLRYGFVRSSTTATTIKDPAPAAAASNDDAKRRAIETSSSSRT